jgi:hypothetical protein
VIALTQKDVLAHEVVVPWSEPYQVERDLLLCLAMRAIFEDQFLSGQAAMRGSERSSVWDSVQLAVRNAGKPSRSCAASTSSQASRSRGVSSRSRSKPT